MLQVDGDPARVAESGEAEDAPPLGEVTAERARRADDRAGGNARHGTGGHPVV